MSCDAPDTCHDCGRQEGELHERACAGERCPFCGGQLISCDCVYKILRIDCTPDTWAYENGFTENQSEAWEATLALKGRVPYILFPNLCAYCGKMWPEMFHVSEEEWQRYIPIKARCKILCRPCYEWIKIISDKSLASIGEE